MNWFDKFCLYLTTFLTITNMIDINDVKSELRDFKKKWKHTLSD